MGYNGFYRNLQNSWISRLGKQPLIPNKKLQLFGYGKVTRPFYINYGTDLKKVDIVDYTDSRYIYGSGNTFNQDYVSNMLVTKEGDVDSGF